MKAMPHKLAELERLLPQVAHQYYRLLLVVGPLGAGKTPLLKALARQHDIPYLNLNLALSQRLLDLSARERPLRVSALLAEIADGQPGFTLILDNIELLFDPALYLNPLASLHSLSRNKTLVVAWNGTLRDGILTYAEPGHPEYRRYERPDAASIVLP